MLDLNNVNITEEQKKMLEKFYINHSLNSEEHNMYTHNPIFEVQKRRERVVDSDYEEVENIIYYVYDWDESYDNLKEIVELYYECNGEECPIEIVDYNTIGTVVGVDGSNRYINNETDYLKAYGVDVNCDEITIGYYWETVAYFFIREEAEKYRVYQKHNLGVSRVYCNGAGYANYGDYHHFYKLLMEIGKEIYNNNNIKGN